VTAVEDGEVNRMMLEGHKPRPWLSETLTLATSRPCRKLITNDYRGITFLLDAAGELITVCVDGRFVSTVCSHTVHKLAV